MNRRVLMRVAAAVGVLMVFSTVGHAAELKVFTSVALKQALNELSPIFEQKTGNKLSISYDLAAVQKKRILDGEHADVIILTRAMMEELIKQNKLATANIVNVARNPGRARPGSCRGGEAGYLDRRRIQADAAVSQIDLPTPIRPRAAPERRGCRQSHRASQGIADQMKAKTTLVPGAEAPDLVAKGEVEFGIAQASEIVPVAGVQLVGPLPGELGSMTLFTGGVGAGTPSADAAKALIEFLSGKDAAPRFKSKGFETGL